MVLKVLQGLKVLMELMGLKVLQVHKVQLVSVLMV